MANLATRNDVLFVAYGRTDGLDVSGSDVDIAIETAQEEIFDDYGDSVHTQFNIISTRRVYEFRKNRQETHEIKFVFVKNPQLPPQDTINRNEIISASYTPDLNANTLSFSADQVGGWNASICEVNYIPKSWHHLAKNKAALNLLDSEGAQINPGEGEPESPRITRIAKRIRRLEGTVAPKQAVGSFENIEFDERTDKEIVDQRRFNRTP